MSGQSNKFLLTQSLVVLMAICNQGRGDRDEFLSTLRREKKPQSKAMLDGIRFENMVHAVSEGAEIGPESRSGTSRCWKSAKLSPRVSIKLRHPARW